MNLCGPDDAGDCWASVDTDPRLQIDLQQRAERIHDVEHLEREVRHPAGMVVHDDRQPAGDHVCIADRLDLLEPALRDRTIKVREYCR